MCTQIKPKYMAKVGVEGSILLATDASVNYNVPTNFYDGIYGLNDVGGTKGPLEGGGLKTQKGLARPGGNIAAAQVSFLASNHFLEAAKTGARQDVQFDFFCGDGFQLSPAFVNSYNFSCAQGGIPTINVDLIGYKIVEGGGVPSYDCSPNGNPISTWRDVTVTFPFDSFCPQSIDFNISNSFTPLYTRGSLRQGFSAHTIRPKIQDVTGSITFAAKSTWILIPTQEYAMSINFPGYSVDMHITVISGSSATSGSYSTVTYNFQGIKYAFGS